MLSAATNRPAQPAAAPPPPVSCTERFHERLKASTKAWQEMPLRGFQPGFQAMDLYELRNCVRCGSTLARAVKIVKLQYVRMPRMAVATARRGACRARSSEATATNNYPGSGGTHAGGCR